MRRKKDYLIRSLASWNPINHYKHLIANIYRIDSLEITLYYLVTEIMEIQHLSKVAGGLNIEGGFPHRDLLKTSPQALWVNLVVVLDRPLIDHHLFDDILAKNPYPLLESAIEELNESKMLTAYLATIGYYCEHGRSLINLSRDMPLRMMIHIHQDTICQPLINLLRRMVNEMMAYFETDVSKHVIIDYRTDAKWYDTQDYGDTHVLISLSQCAGLAPHLEPGALLVPSTFIPYDIEKKILFKSQTYHAPNDLSNRLDDILVSKYSAYGYDYITANYHSANPKKQHRATILAKEDFVECVFLQVDKLWNPTNPQEIVEIQ